MKSMYWLSFVIVKRGLVIYIDLLFLVVVVVVVVVCLFVCLFWVGVVSKDRRQTGGSESFHGGKLKMLAAPKRAKCSY